MTLYLKKKHFSWRTQFTVTDENEQTRFTVRPEIISISRHMHIMDNEMNEVGEVKGKLMALNQNPYAITAKGEDLGMLKPKTSFMKVKYDLTGKGWEVRSNFLQNDFTITDGDMEIASIHKKTISWGESYIMEIGDEENEVAVVAIVLTLNAIKQDQADANRDND